MSGSVLGISSVGNFVTRPVIGDDIFNNDGNKALADNGVTDTALFWKGNKTGFPLAWLDTLSPAQLSETTEGTFEQGSRVTTYGNLRLYKQLEQDLGDHISALLLNGSGAPSQSLSASSANSFDRQAVHVIALAHDLQSNRAGSLTAAAAYLSSDTESDNAPQFSAQVVLDRQKQASAYKPTGSHGYWPEADTASTALQLLTSFKPVDNLI